MHSLMVLITAFTEAFPAPPVLIHTHYSHHNFAVLQVAIIRVVPLGFSILHIHLVKVLPKIFEHPIKGA